MPDLTVTEAFDDVSKNLMCFDDSDFGPYEIVALLVSYLSY